MSFGRANSKRTKRHLKRASRKPRAYKRKKTALRRRHPGTSKKPLGPLHTALKIEVGIARNPNAGKDKNAIQACAAVPKGTPGATDGYICVAGKNPRVASSRLLKKVGSAVSRRTGTFAGLK